MKKQKTLLWVAITCMAFAAVIFVYQVIVIPDINKNLTQQYAGRYQLTQVLKVKDELGIASGTEITQDMFNESTIITEQVPYEFLPKKGNDSKNNQLLVARDKSEVIGKVLQRKISGGEYVFLDTLGDKSTMQIEEQYRRLREYKVYNTVAGDLKTGSVVDLLVSYGNGDYDIIVPKLKIKKLIQNNPTPAATSTTTNSTQSAGNTGSTGTSTTTTTTTQNQPVSNDPTMVTLALNEFEYRDVELAKKLGKLEVRLYLDESQVDSKATFDYTQMKDIVTWAAEQQQLKGDIDEYNKNIFFKFITPKSGDEFAAALYNKLNQYLEARKNQQVQQQEQQQPK